MRLPPFWMLLLHAATEVSWSVVPAASSALASEDQGGVADADDVAFRELPSLD
ncbi:hypothetical protein BKA25_005436 [Actinoalloteichus hymeniacidonis]|uniref:Uncharacterized protein n=1 Tax=Actinoalloteichus hymeniacidonis TaxID=340345 RepID=A0AAC9HKF9_9PSEU|nr:hypothetical protein TL08_00150 [Actinoalloteichus hymeniacidonis]MBB5911120.1 hypothetical protein [Actinoalloteichus hymeniacidonis]